MNTYGIADSTLSVSGKLHALWPRHWKTPLKNLLTAVYSLQNIIIALIHIFPNYQQYIRGGTQSRTKMASKERRGSSISSRVQPREHSLYVLSPGGGSALLVAPDKNLTLEDKQTATELLLKAGADIFEVNTVRKHLSQVKGGRLAEIAYPAKIISLILSDVIGDKLDVIASGPTSPDSSSYKQALSVFEKYALLDKAPKPVIDLLKKGQRGLIPETPKYGNPIFQNISNIIVGSNKTALLAAQEKAEHLGLMTEIISSEISGEAKEVGNFLSEKIINLKKTKRNKTPLCLLSGGETTVTVRGNGLGGRNTELALSFALGIEDHMGITLLSAGTDGTDGPTDAAGAVVTGETWERALACGLYPTNFLQNNDSYKFFDQLMDLEKPGLTGTNVNDLIFLILY